MTSTERAQLLRLLAVLCDGQLSDGEHERLEELLSTDREARRTYLQYVDVHARLVMHPGLAKGRKMPPKEAWAWAALEEAAGMERRAAAWNSRRRRGMTWQRVASIAGVAATVAVAATLLLQVMLRSPPEPIAVRPILGPFVEPPSYVATLAQAADAQWDADHAALTNGSRLLPGLLKLESGLARIHFDSGVDLLVEAPAELRLESAKAAELLSGKVVFQAEAASAPFLLRTPTSLLVDTGTEYGVEVVRQREELHVFSGEVQREAVGAKADKSPELIGADQARLFTSAAAGTPTPVAPDRFVRSLPTPPAPAPNPLDGLLAYEGFDYEAPTDFRDGNGKGGMGWNTHWKYSFPPQPVRPRHTLNIDQGLAREGATTASVGGCYEFAGSARYSRKLAVPVRLDEDAAYYLSYLFRRGGPPAGPRDWNMLKVQLRESGARDEPPGQRHVRRWMNFGVWQRNNLIANVADCSDHNVLPLTYGETYLLVAKIVAGRDNPDQTFVRVYAAEEPVDASEPENWSLVVDVVYSDLVLDTVDVEIKSNRRQHAIDELRLGTTWSSVTAPYLTAPAAQP